MRTPKDRKSQYQATSCPDRDPSREFPDPHCRSCDKPDRERALALLRDYRPRRYVDIADAMLEFAAQEIERLAASVSIPGHALDRGPMMYKRADELRSQVGKNEN